MFLVATLAQIAAIMKNYDMDQLESLLHCHQVWIYIKQERKKRFLSQIAAIMKNCRIGQSETLLHCHHAWIYIIQERKKSFLAQIAAISNMSKSDINELVDNVVEGK